MRYIKCIKDTVLLTAGKLYGINKLNFRSAFVKVFRPSDNDWVMSDKENFDMGPLLDHNPDLKNETQPITKEYKMKKFQNEQQEQLHNALINAGFTDCGGKNLPNDTGECNYGYINKQLDEYIYFDYCIDGGVDGGACIRNISNDKLTAFYGAPIADIITHYESLGQTQPITKENIVDVLKHNGYNESTLEAYCELFIRNSTTYYGSVMLNNVLDWLGTVEAITGKLKPLPKLEEIVLKVGDKIKFRNICPTVIKSFDYVNQKVNYECGFDEFNNLNKGHIESVNGKSGIYKIPEFNFEQYLLDNGFKKTTGIYDVIFSVSPHLSIYKSESTPAGKWSCGGCSHSGNPTKCRNSNCNGEFSGGFKMTTVKEFKEQKQEVAINLSDVLDRLLEIEPNLASTIVADQIKAIHKLQPPRPTCATCEDCVEIVKWGELEFQCRNQNVPGDAADRNMGCIHHSEYKEVKND